MNYYPDEEIDRAMAAAGVDVAPYSVRGLRMLYAMVDLIGQRMDYQKGHWVRRTAERLDRFYNEMMHARRALHAIFRYLKRAESMAWDPKAVEALYPIIVELRRYEEAMRAEGVTDVFKNEGRGW